MNISVAAQSVNIVKLARAYMNISLAARSVNILK